MENTHDVFLAATPGLEAPLLAEAHALGLHAARAVPGGVEVTGGLPAAITANLRVRSGVRVLWRVAAFRAMHLAQLDKRAKRLEWRTWLNPAHPLRVEATCRKSRIYHHKAAAQRIAGALQAQGFTLAPEADLVVKARIEDDLCTLSVDTTGAALHKRGHKHFVGKAPLRESMAAGFLHLMGYDGSQAVVDPMCGSGTIPIEAAEIATGLWPGRSRAFAFEHLPGATRPPAPDRPAATCRFYGYDRDQGAIQGATQNAARAGVACAFSCQPVSALEPPEGPPGIVLTNPPYGARIGTQKQLFGLYASLGTTLAARFGGWRVGVITSDRALARTMGLALEAIGPVDHSGTKVWLWHGQL